MKNFKYFVLSILSVFFISETLFAVPQKGGRRPEPKPSSRAVEANRPSVPVRATDTVRSSLTDMSVGSSSRLPVQGVTRSQADSFLRYLERFLTREQIEELITGRIDFDITWHPLYRYVVQVREESAILYLNTEPLNNPLLREIMKRSLRWTIDESTTRDSIKDEIDGVIRSMEGQEANMTRERITAMLTEVESLYDILIVHIDAQIRASRSETIEGLGQEDIRVTHLIGEVLGEISASI